MNKQNKVLKFKRRKSLSMGVIVFLILFIYIAIKVGLYFAKDQMSVYEVQEGSTSADNQVVGLILRQEELVNSTDSGYITSYQKDGARIAKDMPLFSVNSTLQNTTDNTKLLTLKDRDIAQIKHEIKTYTGDYSDSDFGKIYSFSDEVKSTIIEIQNNNMISDNGQATGENPPIKDAVLSKKSGIVTYYQDEYENITPDKITTELLSEKNREKYKKINLRTTDKINKNTPVCKLIESENWELIVKLNKTQYNKLKNKKSVSITVLADGTKMTPTLELKSKGDLYYGILTLNRNMTNYLAERFLEVELNLDSDGGLKIPISSLVEKDFYEVPIAYITKGGNSKKQGVIKVEYANNGDVTYPFVSTDIYNDTDKYAYIDANQFKAGTKIQINGKKDQYTLSKTVKLTGVYNVNNGYAVFRRVEIVFQDKEYCIIKKGSKYGISEFDHIALDSKTAVEQKLIY